MINYDEILESPPFSLDKRAKSKLFDSYLKTLCLMHYDKCEEYKKIVDKLDCHLNAISHYEDLPFLPVRLFKEFDLKSISQETIFKTMTSSGTSGQAVSKIYLDKFTAANQQKTLVKIVSNFTQTSRMPMLIIDCPSVVKDRNMFSARGAAILGFSIFGADRTYALDDDMNIDFVSINRFIQKYQGRRILLFGFTFVIWQFFYSKLKDLNTKIDLSNAVLIHGGGWKKLINQAVSKEEYKEALRDMCGINNIHDYYGMVEQTGCIYMECEYENLHASVFSDIIVRKPADFSIAKKGEKGIIQVCSLLPISYPGHSLLTEDEGVVLGEDDCPCRRKGKYFQILGRIKNAEIRGCSDTYEKH